MGLFTKGLSRAQRRAQSLLEDKTYDYIIAGGGTAGCVLANRLTEDPKTRVLVLEAGRANPSHPYVQIPTAVLKLFKSKWDWNFASEPAPQLAERQIYLCRGKGVGGSSLVNVMLYTRGAAADYDAWAEACDDATWKGSEMLQYFTKSEACFSTSNSGAESQWHGADGPAAVSDVPYVHPLSEAFLDAAVHDAGYAANPDFNDWSRPQAGFGKYQVSQRGGARESAASAYMTKAVRDRPNLDVVQGAVVKRVVFDGQQRATGVEVLLTAPGEDPIVDPMTDDEDLRRRTKPLGEAVATLDVANNAAAEVLVTAGAIGSPQILMLSGVGAKSELEPLGIPVVADRPGVGKNLQDHPACLVSKRSNADAPKSHSTALRIPGTTATNPVAAAKWLFARKGPLTSPGCDHGGFLTLAETDSGDASSSPDVQLRFLATKSITPDGMSTIAKSWSATRNHPDGFTIQAICARPKSKDGSVKLASADPLVKPTIRTPFFTDDADLDTMVEALKVSRSLMAQPALDKYAADEEFPGPAVQTDAQLKSYARETAHTANALVGTCKLGVPQRDAAAVVTNELKVYGVDGVRVCDSSVMPTLPGGQTASSTIAIAEKAADMLRDAAAAPAPPLRRAVPAKVVA